MLINSIQKTNFKANLVPKSEYKGVILKLTNADKEKIKVLQIKKAQMELELDALEKYIKRIKITTTKKLKLEGAFFTLQGTIQDIEDMIKEIKIKRLTNQKAKLNKKI